MNSINKIGIRIAIITTVCIVGIFGIWKVIEYGISSYKTQKVATIATITPTPSIPPSPTINPNLENELKNFADNVQKDLSGYTKKYVDSLPTGTTKEQVLDQKKIEEFVDANRQPLLPDLVDGALKTTTTAGKATIQKYLDSISPTQNKDIAVVTGDMITQALEKQQSSAELEAMVPIRASVEKNLEIFTKIKAPKEAQDLHKKLLQATTSLLNNITLLQNMRNDLIGGLIGQKNLADLNGVFTDIGNQILSLETKYDIK